MKINTFLRAYLIFGGLYLGWDALIHLLNIKLADTQNIWPVSANTYSALISNLFGSFGLLVVLLAFEVQRNLAQYRAIIKLTAVWALIHGAILIYYGTAVNFAQKFQDLPSLRVWIPDYNLYLIFESLIMFGFSLTVYLWLKSDRTS